MIFSGFLSVIPLCISPDKVQSTYKLEYVRDRFDPYVVNYTSYPKEIVKIYQGGRQSGLIIGDMILLDPNEFSSQEAYLYADYDSYYIYSTYFGLEIPTEELEDGQVLIEESEDWCNNSNELKEQVIEGFGEGEKITINYEQNCG